MAFRAVKGRWGLRWYSKTGSQAFANNSLVSWSSGLLIPSTNATDLIVGIIRKAVASTDSDYASTTKVPVEVPTSPSCEVEADVTTGTLVTTSVGDYFDLTDASGVDQSASADDILLCTGFISATKGRFAINAVYLMKNSV